MGEERQQGSEETREAREPGNDTPRQQGGDARNTCPECGGRRRGSDGSSCPQCGGTGSVEADGGGG